MGSLLGAVRAKVPKTKAKLSLQTRPSSKLRSKALVVRRRRHDHTMSGPGWAASDARQAFVRAWERARASVRARAAGQRARVV